MKFWMKVFTAVCLIMLAAGVASAQSKVDSAWTCAKATMEHAIPVGDKPGHTYSISQGKCTATKGEIAGVKEKEGLITQSQDTTATNSDWHGIFVETMANGDKMYVSFTGKSAMKNAMPSGPMVDNWTTNGGTGKFANAKGSGTCNGKMNPDGSSSWTCSGNVTGVK